MTLGRLTSPASLLAFHRSVRRRRAALGVTLLLVTAVGSGGCMASSMAKHGYNPADTWLRSGVARADVDRYFGQPLTETTGQDGRLTAAYVYGYSNPNPGLQFVHGVLEAATFGLWLYRVPQSRSPGRGPGFQ